MIDIVEQFRKRQREQVENKIKSFLFRNYDAKDKMMFTSNE